MNWTGGQLHRSARQGTLSKTQRQNLAKSRQLAIDRNISFSKLDKRRQQTTSGDDQVEQAMIAERQTPLVTTEIEPAGTQLPHGIPRSKNSQSDTLKRQLLQDPDWGVVSATRPLEITFAPVEEIERFGKRRKLNDTDRERLSVAHGGQSLPSLLKSRQTDVLWNDDLDRIKICINGRPVGMQSSDSPGMITTNTSSQSMLLGHEEDTNLHSSASGKKPWIPSPNRFSLRPKFSHARPRFESPMTPAPRTPAFKGVGSIKRRVTPGLDRYQLANTNTDHHRPTLSERSVTQSPSVLDSPQPTRQHFTIDDQEPAEQTMVEEPVRPSHFEQSRSPLGILNVSPKVPSAGAFTPAPSSWLPQPQRPDASSSPLTARSHAVRLTHSAANQPPPSNISSNPFLDTIESDHRSPTVKVFGQIVQIRSHGAGHE